MFLGNYFSRLLMFLLKSVNACTWCTLYCECSHLLNTGVYNAQLTVSVQLVHESGFWLLVKPQSRHTVTRSTLFPELLCRGQMAVLLKLLLVQPRIHDKCPLSPSKETSTLPLALLGLQNNTKVTFATFAWYIHGIFLLILILSHAVLLEQVNSLLFYQSFPSVVVPLAG